MSPALVGIDVGTTAVKGLAIGDDGTVLERVEAGLPLSMPRPGWAEQDPADWWEASESVLGRLRSSVGRPAGIGLSGQMHGLVALDCAGRVLRPAILWSDQRTAAECAEIESRVGLERLIARLGTADAVMIGDRSFDVEAARANGVRAIGVTWGIGERGELERAGADLIVERPEELAALLEGGGSQEAVVR